MIRQIGAHQMPARFPSWSGACRTSEADIDRAARSDGHVLIVGETGAGKEEVARLIHDGSARRLARFVLVNCAGLPDSLLESELFGHVCGSFPGAYSDKAGRLETAANGTVVLDEVGDMSAHMQRVLLRFLETGDVQPVGAAAPRARVNVRLIAVTREDLQARVRAGAFRTDLFSLLNAVPVAVPPLRERADEVAVSAAG